MRHLFLFVALALGAKQIQTAILEPHQNPSRPPVRFNENGTFKIVTFTDLHFGEGVGSEWGPANDRKSIKVMTDILSWEHPDFVVFTGDLMSAEVMHPNGTATMDYLLEPVVKGNYKWASTYGNHDIGNNVSREEILQAEQKYDQCYTQQGEAGLVGNTNYFIPIFAPENSSHHNATSDKPALILWFFDSRGGRNSSGGIPYYIHETVVNWFTETVKEMNAKWGNIPSLAFFHYPTDEYKPIHESIEEHPECPGITDDIVTPQEKDTGFMNALVESENIRAAFVGHNHGNGWCCNYKSLALCYNRQSGHGGGWVGWTRGSRIVELNITDLWGPPLNYIRLENGTIVDQFIAQVFPIPTQRNEL